MGGVRRALPQHPELDGVIDAEKGDPRQATLVVIEQALWRRSRIYDGDRPRVRLRRVRQKD
jgi:hypothetical protein